MVPPHHLLRQTVCVERELSAKMNCPIGTSSPCDPQRDAKVRRVDYTEGKNMFRALLAPLFLVASLAPALADKIPLPALSAYLNDLTTAETDFTQINADGSIATGKLYIKRSGRVRFEYAPPDRSLVLASAGSVAIFDAKSNWPPEQQAVGCAIMMRRSCTSPKRTLRGWGVCFGVRIVAVPGGIRPLHRVVHETVLDRVVPAISDVALQIVRIPDVMLPEPLLPDLAFVLS